MAAALAVVSTTALSVLAVEPGYELRIPQDGVKWHGIAMGGGAGTTAPMVYIAPTPLLGLVAVLTHGALVSGSRSADDRRRQEEADAVLASYRPALDAWPAAQLAAAAWSLLELPVGGGRVVEASPAYAMFPDRRRLLLEVAMNVIDPAGAHATQSYVVRVQSPRREEPYPVEDEGAQIKQDATAMLSHATAIALYTADHPVAEDAPYRTYRFLDGDRTGFERAQWVAQGCGRVVLRTLRGYLLSVPLQDDQPTVGCEGTSYRLPAQGG